MTQRRTQSRSGGRRTAAAAAETTTTVVVYDRELHTVGSNGNGTAPHHPHDPLHCGSTAGALHCGPHCPVVRCGATLRRQTADFVHADGGLRRVTAEPILDAQGKFAGAVETIVELPPAAKDTPRDDFRGLLDCFHDAITVHDLATGAVVEANAAAAQMWERSRDELLGVDPGSLSAGEPPFSQADALRWMHTAANEGPQSVEWLARAQDGRLFWVDLRIQRGHFRGHDHIFVSARDISDRKATVDRLRASDATFRGLIDSVSEAICVQDATGRFLEVNRAFERLYGLPRSAFVGHRIEAFAAPGRNNFTHLARAFRQAFAGEPQVVQFWAQRGDGTEFLKEANQTAGTYFGQRAVISVLRDITAQQRSHEARNREDAELRQDAARFHQILGSIPGVAVQGYRPDGTVTYWNSASERLYGFTAKEALGRDILDLIVPEPSRAAVRAGVARMVETGEAIPTTELEMMRRDGARLRVLASHAVVRLPGREVELYCFDLDLSERYQHEQERIHAAVQLQASENRFRTLLERASSVAVQGYGPDGNIRYWNAGSARLYGFSAAEALGRDIVDLIIPPALRDEVRQAIRRMAETGEALPPAELELQRRDGSLVPVFSSHAVVQVPDTGAELYCIDIDLTDRRRAEEERLEIQRRLLHGQKLESLGVLAGGIAHDFNNLLTSILGNLELAISDVGPVSPARPFLQDAVRSSRQAADLTRQMLAYAGRSRFVVRDTNLSDLIEHNGAVLRASVPPPVDLRFELAPDLPAVPLDASQVQQMIAALVTNSVEAMETRTGRITVRTGSEDCDTARLARTFVEERPAPGRFVFVEIEDEGCGMDAATLQRVFEPFFSTKFAGRGLGLPVAQGVMRAHLGALLIETEPGRGTKVRALFPVASQATDDAPAAPIPFRAAAPAPDHPALLLIDDEEPVRRIGERMGTRLGYRTTVVASGAEGIDIVRQAGNDLRVVIVDLTMPGMGGVECLRAIRELRPHLPVILSSGFAGDDVAARFGEAGFSAFLPKPFTVEQLRRVIESAARPAAASEP